ncbi:hypothetical protein SLA2020_060820 [Shorea laevis]
MEGDLANNDLDNMGLEESKDIWKKEQDSEEKVAEIIKHRSFHWLKAKLYPKLQQDIWKDNPKSALRRHTGR